MSDRNDPVASLNKLAQEKSWPMRFAYALEFENPNLASLLRLWESNAGRSIPRRSQFTARALKPYLPNLSIVERESTGERATYRFRLIGTELARLFGDRTGEVLEQALPAPFIERWAAGYDTVLAARRPVRVVTQFELPQVSYLDGEGFHAPLLNDAGELGVILSATYLKSRTASQNSGKPA